MKKTIFLSLASLLFISLTNTSCKKEDATSPDPVAVFTYQADVNNPLLVKFSNVSKYQQTNIWSFGDDSISTELSPVHEFAKSGLYTVTLLVKNGDGTESRISQKIAVFVKPVADFTFIVNETDPLSIVFTNTSKNIIASSWDFGDDKTSQELSPSHTYSKGGFYTVILIAKGVDSSETVKYIKIEVKNPEPANPIKNGDMADQGAWNIWSIGSVGVTNATFGSGSNKVLKMTGTGDSNVLIWQEVTVEAGVQYKFTADTKGAGINNAWFEVYFISSLPDEGTDIPSSIAADYAINTWGCTTSKATFTGDINKVVCWGTTFDKEGLITFDSNTIYVCIKCGVAGGTLGTGITLDNMKLTKVE